MRYLWIFMALVVSFFLAVGIYQVTYKATDNSGNSASTLRIYYAKVLALVNPKDAREMIEKDMDNETNVNKKIKLLIAFADTGINDDYVVNKLEDMLYNTIPNSSFHWTAKDIISVGLVMHLSRSDRDDRFLKLVKIASDNRFTFDTRWIALRKICYYLPKNNTKDINHIKIQLQSLSQQILSSPNDYKDKTEQELLIKEILKIIQILEGA